MGCSRDDETFDPTELQQQLARLEERSLDLAEGADKLPRGNLPALFRALRAAPADEQERGLRRLVARLPDLPLARPTLDLAWERELAGPLLDEVRALASERRAYCVLRQVAALADALEGVAPSLTWVLELLRLLLGAGEAADLRAEAGEEALTALLLEVDGERLTTALEEVLRLRLRSPASARDRTSAAVAQGALRALVVLAPDAERVQQVATQVLAAEARRAGKGEEPALALEGLDALRRAPALARARLLHPLLDLIARKKVRDRADEVYAEAMQELDAEPQEQLELTARAGGADPDGWVQVPLEEGGEVRLRIGAAGAVVRDPPGPAPSGVDERALESAARELSGAWEELARRLEEALVTNRDWSPRLWRSIFLSGHPLWDDLVGRVLWEVRRPTQGAELASGATEPSPSGVEGPSGGVERVTFAIEGGRAVDVLGDPATLPADDDPHARIGLAHPVLLDPDELELWRERALDRAARGAPLAPFAQAWRAVARPELEPAAEQAPAPAELARAFERLLTREAHKDELEALALRRGWSGTPLVGAGTFELERPFPGHGLRVRLRVESVHEEFRATVQQRKEAHRRAAREGEKVEVRRPKEVRPRVRVAAVELLADAGSARLGATPLVPVVEALRDLDELTDPLSTMTDLSLRAWQQQKWKEPKEAWRDVVLAYRRGSPAAFSVRRALIAAFVAREEGLELRLEDRFAITGNHVIELGTGLVHEGPPKDHLPGWKAAERAQEGLASRAPLAFPFRRGADPEMVRVVELVIGLAK